MVYGKTIKNTLFLISLLICGLIFFYISISGLKSSVAIGKNHLTTIAQVIESKSYRSNKKFKRRIYIVAEFTDLNGTKRRLKSSFGYRRWSAPKVGEKIKVFYNRQSPDIAVIGNIWHMWLWPIIYGLIGILIFKFTLKEITQLKKK